MTINREMTSRRLITAMGVFKSMIGAVALPHCIQSSNRLHSLLCRSQRSLLSFSRALLVGRNVSKFFFIDFVDHLYISRYLTLHALVCLASHLTLVVEILSSFLNVVNRAANNFNSLVLVESLIDKIVSIT